MYVVNSLKMISNLGHARTSYFTFVVIPLAVPTVESTRRRHVVPVGTLVRQPSREEASRTYVKVAQLVAALANQPYADRVVDYSLVEYFISFAQLNWDFRLRNISVCQQVVKSNTISLLLNNFRTNICHLLRSSVLVQQFEVIMQSNAVNVFLWKQTNSFHP